MNKLVVGIILVGCIHDHKRDKIFIVFKMIRLELNWVCGLGNVMQLFGFPKME